MFRLSEEKKVEVNRNEKNKVKESGSGFREYFERWLNIVKDLL